jgi:hypothetical protein
MAVLVALACMLAICTYRYIQVWTPLQRFYFTTYIRSALRSAASSARTGEYDLLAVTTKNGSHWASDGEVTEGKTASGEATLALTPKTLKAGALHLVLEPVQANDAKIREFLRNAIYGDQTLTRFLQPALWGSLAVLFFWLAFTLPKDATHRRREGRSPKGPLFVSPQVFDRRNHHAIDFELSAEELPVVGLPKKHPMFVERHSEVRPEDRPKAVAVAEKTDGALDRRIRQQEVKEDPEKRPSRRPARKERYFQ